MAMGDRPAYKVGKNNPERRMRIRDFDRVTSSLGAKHKGMIKEKWGVEKSHFDHDPEFQELASFTGNIRFLLIFHPPRLLGSPLLLITF